MYEKMKNWNYQDLNKAMVYDVWAIIIFVFIASFRIFTWGMGIEMLETGIFRATISLSAIFFTFVTGYFWLTELTKVRHEEWVRENEEEVRDKLWTRVYVWAALGLSWCFIGLFFIGNLKSNWSFLDIL